MGRRRASRQVFAINDRLKHLEQEEARVSAELDYHRHLADDAVRDAAVIGSSMHEGEAERALADVERFERALDEIDHRRAVLLHKRNRLLDRMSSFEDYF